MKPPLICPICKVHIRLTHCAHALQHRSIDGILNMINGTAYYVYYSVENKTRVIKDAPYKWKEGWGRKDEVILELDGFHILTMDRVERLLLLK